jgi:exodeoxyribonuclease VII large subunit
LTDKHIITVSELNGYIKALVESDVILNNIAVKGEISNYRPNSSGHMYFSLKDEGGIVRAVMFRGNASKLKFLPENGMKVIATGYVSVFSRDGQYPLSGSRCFREHAQRVYPRLAWSSQTNLPNKYRGALQSLNRIDGELVSTP